MSRERNRVETTMLDLFSEISEYTRDDDETEAVVMHMLRTRQVLLRRPMNDSVLYDAIRGVSS